MALLPNTDNVDEKSSYDPIPAGTYRAVVVETKQVETSKGDPMLKVTLEVIDGQYRGRKIFDNIILAHSNPKTEEIGLRLLKQLKLAAGKPQAREETELWDVPVLAVVRVEEGTDGYDDKNRVSKFKPIDGTATSTAPAESRATATPPVHAGGGSQQAGGKRSSWRS